MSAIGDAGHVSFLVLEDNVVGTERVVQERDALGVEVRGYDRPIVDGTVESGRTDCHAGTVVAVAPDGLVIGGFNHRGEPRQWRGVLDGTEPKARPDDPAGHVFHLASDCPEGR